MDDSLQTDTCEHDCLQGRFTMFEELLTYGKSKLQSVDTYLPFAENQLGRAAVTRLNPSRRSGSITLVVGPSGVGKTHLALSTLQQRVHHNPRLKYALATAKEMCEMMRLADERQSLADFLEKCQCLDLLVCEDLHGIEQHPALQPYLVMLVETLETGLTQILLTSQRPAGELRGLDQRLVSRCHGGLCVSMSLPSFESRVLLVQAWFREFKLPVLKPFVASARFLAERLPVTPRELRQAVMDLAAKQRRQPAPVDVAYLERWLAKDNRTPRLSFEAILAYVGREFGVEPSDIRSRSRQQGLAVPRQCAMWLARELTGQPLGQIGDYFDRSHTTVSHSLSRLNELLPTIPSLRQQVHKLRQQLNELPREDCA